MCGFVGSINFKIPEETARRLLIHRGPDEQAGLVDGPVSFYHVRLSIQDVKSGSQPMTHGSLITAYNGEIYNHMEVRRQFQLDCQTESDTETLLRHYEKKGIDALQDFDGMFAFALLDKSSRKLLLARDRAGKKPLYYYRGKNSLLFASELNCLRALVDLEVDDEKILGFLQTGLFYKEATPYKGVRELPPGSSIEVDIDTLQSTESVWWNINQCYQPDTAADQGGGLQESLNEVDSLLEQSVQRRLVSSDLEVGAFLSGGIDSGLVVAKAATILSKPLKTFTMSFEGSFDESALASSVAKRYGTDHHQIHIDLGNLHQDIESILSSYGEPFADSSAIPSFYVSREASKLLTVVLNGDGADELFGGYRRYVPYARLNMYDLPGWASTCARQAIGVLPKPGDKMSKYNFLHRLLSLVGANGLNRYLTSTTDIFSGTHVIAGTRVNAVDQSSNSHSSQTSLKQSLRTLSDDYDAVTGSELTSLQKIMLMDFTTQLGALYLPKMDIATMRNSLEARSPFLSRELMAYAPKLPDLYKINGNTTKYLLRRLSEQYLPQNVQAAPKRGFEIPLQQWVNGQLNPIINDYLTNPDCWIKQYLYAESYEKLLADKLNVGAEKRAKMLWTLFASEVWYQKCCRMKL